MNESKWRIRKDPRFGNRWVIFSPGSNVRTSFQGASHAHCVSALPFLVRIRNNQKILRGR